MKIHAISVMATVLSLLVAGCGKDDSKSKDSDGGNNGEEQGPGDEGGDAVPLKFKDGLKALALTGSAFGLTEGPEESNLKALTDEGLVSPWASDFHLNEQPIFTKMVVTDSQIVLLTSSSNGLNLTQASDSDSDDKPKSSADAPAFTDVTVTPGTKWDMDRWPTLSRIERSTGKLQFSNDTASQVQADEAGNIYYMSESVYGEREIRKIATNGEVSKVYSLDEDRPFTLLTNGMVLVKNDKITELVKNGKAVNVAENAVWSAVFPDGNLYFGNAAFGIDRFVVDSSTIEKDWYKSASGKDGKGEKASEGSVKVVTSANEAWLIHESGQVQKAYPGVEDVDSNLNQIDAALSYDNKLVLVGDGKVLLGDEEVASGLGTVVSTSLKGSVLMVAGADGVTEVDLAKKSSKEVDVGGQAVSQIESL